MNIFVYGTLLVPEIWNIVTECPDLVSTPATLSGHSIWRVKEATFPAIKIESADDAGTVPGIVFFDVPETALQRLDRYEDDFYERVPVTVETEQGSVIADVYRVPLDLADGVISEDPWTLSWFEQNALERFLENVFDH